MKPLNTLSKDRKDHANAQRGADKEHSLFVENSAEFFVGANPLSREISRKVLSNIESRISGFLQISPFKISRGERTSISYTVNAVKDWTSSSSSAWGNPSAVGLALSSHGEIQSVLHELDFIPSDLNGCEGVADDQEFLEVFNAGVHKTVEEQYPQSRRKKKSGESAHLISIIEFKEEKKNQKGQSDEKIKSISRRSKNFFIQSISSQLPNLSRNGSHFHE